MIGADELGGADPDHRKPAVLDPVVTVAQSAGALESYGGVWTILRTLSPANSE